MLELSTVVACGRTGVYAPHAKRFSSGAVSAAGVQIYSEESLTLTATLEDAPMHRPLSLLLLCLLSACSLTEPTPTPTPSLGPLTATYRATDLGTLGGTTSYAYAVSADGGVVVGYNLTAAGHT